MAVTYPWANSTARTGACVLCDLTTPHPDRDPAALMYHVTFSDGANDFALLCKAHAVECDLITDRLVAAKTRAEVAVIQHLRREVHRLDVCPLPHEPETVSHRETDDYPVTVVTVSIASRDDDGCQYTLTLPDGRTATIGDGKDDYSDLTMIIDRAFGDLDEEPSHRETPCNRCGIPNLSRYVLRVWSHPPMVGPTVRTDVYLCSQHRPPHLPLEVPVTLDGGHGQMVADLYSDVIRPLLRFDGADEAVITNFYLLRVP